VRTYICSHQEKNIRPGQTTSIYTFPTPHLILEYTTLDYVIIHQVKANQFCFFGWLSCILLFPEKEAKILALRGYRSTSNGLAKGCFEAGLAKGRIALCGAESTVQQNGTSL
jgi:hypothetical protein